LQLFTELEALFSNNICIKHYKFKGPVCDYFSYSHKFSSSDSATLIFVTICRTTFANLSMLSRDVQPVHCAMNARACC